MESNIPTIESSADYEALTHEQQAIVDSWGDGVAAKVAAFEANEQRLRNLFGPHYDGEESSTQ